MPLIKSLSNPTTWIQNWYADDFSCKTKLTDLCVRFDKLCDLGPKYGYHPEPEKCVYLLCNIIIALLYMYLITIYDTYDHSPNAVQYVVLTFN